MLYSVACGGGLSSKSLLGKSAPTPILRRAVEVILHEVGFTNGLAISVGCGDCGIELGPDPFVIEAHLLEHDDKEDDTEAAWQFLLKYGMELANA